MKYFVAIDDEERELVVDGESVTLGGAGVRAFIEQVPPAGSPTLLVSIGTERHRVVARRGERRGQYDLSIGGFRFRVEVLDERARAVRDLAGASARPPSAAHLMAPMPGLIVRVNVNPGDAVRAGQGLVVMEAMKMENELRASAAGTVRKVLVSPGAAVEKGAVLLEMD